MIKVKLITKKKKETKNESKKKQKPKNNRTKKSKKQIKKNRFLYKQRKRICEWLHHSEFFMFLYSITFLGN